MTIQHSRLTGEGFSFSAPAGHLCWHDLPAAQFISDQRQQVYLVVTQGGLGQQQCPHASNLPEFNTTFSTSLPQENCQYRRQCQSLAWPTVPQPKGWFHISLAKVVRLERPGDPCVPRGHGLLSLPLPVSYSFTRLELCQHSISQSLVV